MEITRLGYGLILPPGMASLLNNSDVVIRVMETDIHRPDLILSQNLGLKSISSEWAFSQANNISPLSCTLGKILTIPSAKFIQSFKVSV